MIAKDRFIKWMELGSVKGDSLHRRASKSVSFEGVRNRIDDCLKSFTGLFLLANLLLNYVVADDYLGEIVVEDRQPVISQIANSFELDKDLMKQRGDISLQQALEMVPNLNVRTGGQGVPRVDIRGLRTRHIKLLVDGIPFNSTFDGQFDPTFVPTSQIDRLKVTTGSVSELYGPGAFGVIDVQTRFLHNDQLELNAELGEGENQYLSLQAGGHNGRVNYYGNLTHRSRNYFELSDKFQPSPEEDGDRRLNSDMERNTGIGKLSYQVSDSLQLGLSSSFLIGEYGIPPTVISDEFAARPSYERIENQQGFTLQSSFNYIPDANYYLRGWAYTNHLKQDENRYSDASFSDINDKQVKGSYLTTTKTAINGVGIQSGYAFNKQSRAAFALDWHHDGWEQSGVIRDMAEIGGGGGKGGGNGNGSGAGTVINYGLRPLDEDEAVSAYSFAAEYEVDLNENLAMVAGGGRHWQSPEHLTDTVASSYLLGFHYRINQAFNLHGSWARKIRMPSIRNLFDASRGNPNLDPELLEGAEIGLQYDFEPMKVVLDVTFFHYDIEDFIQRDRVTDRFENLEQARVKGAELSATLQPWEKLSTRLSFSYQDSEDRSESGRDELTNTPGQSLNIDMDYQINKTFALHAKYLYVDEQIFYTRNAPFVAAQLKEVSRVDLRLRWHPRTMRFSAYLGVDNLLDEDYADEYALPAPGRAIFVGVSWQK